MKQIVLYLVIFINASSVLFSQSLRIYNIDVNQGDATLVVMPNGTSMLIDSGIDGMGDDVARIIRDIANLNHIDVYVSSHYHSDHYGGIDKIIQREGIPVVLFYDRDAVAWLPDSKTTQKNFIEYETVSRTKRIYLKPGDKIELDPTVSIKCFVVNGLIEGSTEPITSPHNENSHSLGLVISYNGFDYWTSGDTEEDVEEALAATGSLPNIDVMKINHHGSATSSTVAFLMSLDPEVAIISNGDHGGFRHPRQGTLDRIRSALNDDVVIYQTNKLIKVKTDGGNVPDQFIADVIPDGSEGTILITVSGTSYEVKFLHDGSNWNYPIEN